MAGKGEKKPPPTFKQAWPGCLGLIAIAIVLLIVMGSCFGGDGEKVAAGRTSDAQPAAEKSAAAAQAKALAEQQRIQEQARQKAIASASFASTRQLALVFKDPDSHVGEIFKVWGSVFQFDAATGNDAFLADTANRNTTSYGYFDGETALYTGDAQALKDFVKDDLFTATVEVDGSMSYSTQIGGNTTVPQFTVLNIQHR